MLLTDRNGAKKCIVNPDQDLLLVAKNYKLYLARKPDEEKTYFLRVPNDRSQNGQMNFEAEMLRHLAKCSEVTEARYAETTGNPDARVHYDWLFPSLEDTFLTGEDQGGRQVNMLGVSDAEVSDFMPLPKLKEAFDVDAKTAAWIIGRLFKLQTFLEDNGGFYNFREDQVIIEPKMHRLVYLGWSDAGEVCNWDSVAKAAQAIRPWVRKNDTPDEDKFIELLEYLSDTELKMDGIRAHRTLYTDITKWWGHAYYPFTYFDKQVGSWRQMDATITTP